MGTGHIERTAAYLCNTRFDMDKFSMLLFEPFFALYAPINVNPVGGGGGGSAGKGWGGGDYQTATAVPSKHQVGTLAAAESPERFGIKPFAYGL